MVSRRNKLKSIWATVGVIATIIGLITAYPTLRAMYDEHVLDKPPLVPGTNAILMSLEHYEQRQLKLRHDIEAELKQAHQEDRARLQAELEAVNARLADLPEAYDEALKRIKALEAQLAALEGQVSDSDLAEARKALSQGNLQKAKRLFESVKSAQENAIKVAAGAEYGLGQIAEEEIRWHDASTHYANAARLDPSFDNLRKAREYAWRSGGYAAAHRHGEALLAVARTDGTQEQLATALNEHALTVQAQGRYAEAEGLYREALEIDRATIGEGHPTYAIRLNNLAGVVKAQGRSSEAERLYREAVEITRATVGEGHPNYAIRLNNLAGVLVDQGKPEAARPLYEQALTIFRATLPPDHPHIGVARKIVRACS